MNIKSIQASILTMLIFSSTSIFSYSNNPQSPSKIKPAVANFPNIKTLQEMNNLQAETTRLKLKVKYHQYLIKNKPSSQKESRIQIKNLNNLITKNKIRLDVINKKELGKLKRVAINAGTLNSEEPGYGVGSYGIVLSATATSDIKKGELLLYHANGVYRTEGSFAKLETKSEGWYFKTAKPINKSDRFVVSCIQDSPEEIQNVKNGFMPNSDRARNPIRPYKTNTFIIGRMVDGHEILYHDKGTKP